MSSPTFILEDLKSEDPTVRRISILDLALDVESDRSWTLEILNSTFHQESDLQLKILIRKIQNSLNWNPAHIHSTLSDQKRLRIQKALDSKEYEVLKRASFYILHHTLDEFIPSLQRIAKQQANPYFKVCLIHLYSRCFIRYLSKLLPFLESEKPVLVHSTVDCLSKIGLVGSRRLYPTILELAHHPDPRLSKLSLRVLESLGAAQNAFLFKAAIQSRPEASNSYHLTLQQLEQEIKEAILHHLQKDTSEPSPKNLPTQDPIQSGGNTHLSSLFLQSNSIEIQNIILAHEELDQQSSLLTLLHTDVVPEIMGSVFKFFINSPQPSVRACALSSLAAISPTGDRSFFLPYLKDEDPACVGHAVIALSDDDDYRSLYFDEVSTVLHSKAISDDELENRSALHLITLLQDDHLLELLEFLLYSKQKEFREEMLSQLNSWALVSEEVRAMVESVRLEQDKFDLWDLPEQGLAGLELKAADSENASQTHSKLEMELPKERFKRVIAVNTILLTQDSSYQSRINDLLHDETDVNIRYRLQRAATELETRTSEPDSSHNSDNAQITKALDSKSVNTLKKAFKFIAQHRIETFFPRMLEVSRQQENPFFKQTLIYCISNFGTRYYRTLLDFLRDPDHEVVLDSIQATVATTGIDNWEVFPEFVRLTYHPHIPISSLAKEYVSTLDKEILVHLMESLIRSENSDQRYSAIYAIQALLIPFLEPLLKEVTQDRDPYVADCARVHFKNFCESLEIIDKPGDKPSKQKGDQSGESFKEILNNLEKKTETFELLEGLKKLEEAGVIVHRRIEALQSYCTNQCEEVRCAALKALGRIWPNEDRSWFGNYLEDESAKVAGCALLNLYRDQKSYSQSSDLVTKTLKRLITSPLPLDNILGIQCIAVLKDNQFLELLIFSLYNLVDRSEQLRNLAIDVIEEFCSISKDAERVMEQYRSDQGSFDQWQEEMGTEDLNSKHFEDELLRTFRSPQDSKKIEMIRHILKGEISFRPEILLPLLYEELEKNPEPEILVDLIKVIELIPEKEHWEALSPFLTHENPCVVAQTVESLCQLEDERVLDPVEDLINGDLCQDDQYLKVVGAMKFLRKKNPLLAYEFLEKLGLGNESTREYFVEFLPSFSSSQDRLIHYLLELLAQDMTLNVTRAVVAHLEKAPPRKIVPRVLKVFLGSQNEHATLEIYKYLSMYASRWNLDAVKTLARDAENPEKRELLYALLESIQTRCSGKQPGLVDEQ